ncbi:MAG: PilZ domain-containing protein [Acidobacteria bacterium]|nr:PilZ domain-containing protein [Acidobacteriota bacterium]
MIESRPELRANFARFGSLLYVNSKRGNIMRERRSGERFVISLPVRIRWKGEDGKEVTQEGLTENVGPHGTLIYLPRNLPLVGGKVSLTVTEDPKSEVTVTAEVIRLERNAAHPQAALNLLDNLREWKKKVWETAGQTIANQQPEELDDWN